MQPRKEANIEARSGRSSPLSPFKFTIVATSFDGHEDLLQKYPEWVGIEPKLRALGVTLVHNVDATALDSRVLLPGVSAPQYDHIIFNHPHTGTEDMRRHRSFLGHFFYTLVTPLAGGRGTGASHKYCSSSACHSSSGQENPRCVRSTTVDGRDVVSASHSCDGKGALPASAAVMLAPGGAVHVTLAGDQPERWGLREQAARHGFALAHRRPFPAARIEGYMSKRHQTGKSFQRRASDSSTLSFVWTAGGMGTGVGPQGHSVAARGAYDLPPWLWPEVNMFGPEEPKGRHSSTNTEERGAGDGEGGCNEALGEIASSSASAKTPGCTQDNVADDAVRPELCKQCGKRYKTAQGLRTHTRQVHELQQQEGGFESLPCRHCDRLFTSQIARDQHESAKHVGAFHDIKPDWFEPTIYHDCRPPSPSTSPDKMEHSLSSHPDKGGQSGGHSNLSVEKKHVRCEDGSAPEAAVCTTAQDDVGGGFSRDTEVGEAYPARAQQSSDSSSSGSVRCDICGYWFVDKADEQRHWDNLRPPIAEAVIRHECLFCRKTFGSRRALQQHVNFCTTEHFKS
ncbi:unnamed protein product [Sphacelaria rigidula]